MRPQPDEYAPYYGTYVDLVPNGNVLNLLGSEHRKTQLLLEELEEAQGHYRYAEGKWSINELLVHMIDTEQIMAYRALRFARNDQQELPGFDQDEYIKAIDSQAYQLGQLTEDWAVLRQFSIRMFSHFRNEDLIKVGVASGQPCSVRALACIILGHELHHRKVLVERYLNA